MQREHYNVEMMRFDSLEEAEQHVLHTFPNDLKSQEGARDMIIRTATLFGFFGFIVQIKHTPDVVVKAEELLERTVVTLFS